MCHTDTWHTPTHTYTPTHTHSYTQLGIYYRNTFVYCQITETNNDCLFLLHLFSKGLRALSNTRIPAA